MKTRAPEHWMEDLERRTRHARLQVGSPEYAYAELRVYGQEVLNDIGSLYGDEKLENAMLERGEPLIDIALASFAARRETLAELWKRATTGAYQNGSISKAIRIGCLSNRAVDNYNFLSSVVGKEETQRLFASDDEDEAKALLGNEHIDDKLLAALYERKEPFASISEERWKRLIALTWPNNRLNVRLDTDSGPDLGYGAIQKAIFRLLETAPLKPNWVPTLHHYLLEALNPIQVASVELKRVGEVLERWSNIEATDYKGDVEGGWYTSLSAVDEFRSLIGALYGRNIDRVIHGKPTAPDVADRCSYYGNAKLTVREAEKYINREGDVFVYAAICNSNVLYDVKLRRLVEESGSGQQFKQRYLRICKLVNARWPNFDPNPTAEWMRM